MKIKIYPILSRCIEDGIRVGLERSQKHTDKPDDETIRKEIEDAIWFEIDQCFLFNDDYE